MERYKEKYTVVYGKTLLEVADEFNKFLEDGFNVEVIVSSPAEGQLLIKIGNFVKEDK